MPLLAKMVDASQGVESSNSNPEQTKNSAPSTSLPELPPPPDGGFEAWLQVFGSFWAWFNTFGLTNAYGVFNTYYANEKFPNEKPAVISLIGSIQPFVLIFFSFLAGPLWDAGYCRLLIVSGTAIIVFGYFMVSICDTYWQVMLAQGVLVGFGSALLYMPAVAIIPQYFTRRKAVANGIAASGSAFAGVIYPIAFRQLLQKLSFGWSVRVLAFMVVGTGILPVLCIRRRLPPPPKEKRRRPLQIDFRPFINEPAYGFYTLALFFCLGAQYTPVFFIQDYAQSRNIMSADLASYLLPILNAWSVIGRIAPNLIADRTGGVNVLIPCMTVAAILTFCWITISTTAGCIVFVSLYGFFIGCILSMPAYVISSLCPDPATVGARMGIAFALSSFGLLAGPPVAGAILQSGSWLGVQLFAAALLALATGALVFVRVWVVGWALDRKV